MMFPNRRRQRTKARQVLEAAFRALSPAELRRLQQRIAGGAVIACGKTAEQWYVPGGG